MGIGRPEYQVVKVDTNLDPLSGEPGAHPVGVGTGAAGEGVTGAFIGGAIRGPIGAGIGAVVGAVGGGYAGKGIAEAIDPTVEHKFWRREYMKRPYVLQGEPYGFYGPAYQYGWESYSAFRPKGKTFNEVEADLRRDWEKHRGNSRLSWVQAKCATRDAWSRVEASCGECE